MLSGVAGTMDLSSPPDSAPFWLATPGSFPFWFAMPGTAPFWFTKRVPVSFFGTGGGADSSSPVPVP